MKKQILKIGILVIALIVIIVCSCKKDEEITNNPPEIQSITSNPNTSSNDKLPAGDQLSITVIATDPDGDNLSYLWDVIGGNFIGDTDKSTITWESPITTTDEAYNISVIVSDGELSSTKDISIFTGGVTLCALQGYVYYTGTTIPASGVLITVKTKGSTTSEDGYYEINDIPTGNHILVASKEGYDDFTTEIELISGNNNIDVEITFTSSIHKLYGTITSETNGAGIQDCRISVLNPDGTESQIFTYTSSNGSFEITSVPQANVTIRLSEKCHFETQIDMANSDYQFDAAFETEFTDNRDGKVYAVVEIGEQVWMAQNLNYGERIDGVNMMENNQIVEKYCYDDNESNCDTYGAFYLWNEMMQYDNDEGIQGICPDGWHLPTDDEFKTMTDYLGGDKNTVGGKLKEKGTTSWEAPNYGATNESGFNALATGCRRYTDGDFLSIGIYTSFWSSTECNNTEAWYRYVMNGTTHLHHFCRLKTMGRSVRCIKNE